MHCEKMAVTDMSFLIKEGNSAGVIYEGLHEV
jgi:hypothetical protein